MNTTAKFEIGQTVIATSTRQTSGLYGKVTTTRKVMEVARVEWEENVFCCLEDGTYGHVSGWFYGLRKQGSKGKGGVRWTEWSLAPYEAE